MILLLLDLFVQFAILNVIAFGGITALLPELHRLVVERVEGDGRRAQEPGEPRALG